MEFSKKFNARFFRIFNEDVRRFTIPEIQEKLEKKMCECAANTKIDPKNIDAKEDLVFSKEELAYYKLCNDMYHRFNAEYSLYIELLKIKSDVYTGKCIERLPG